METHLVLLDALLVDLLEDDGERLLSAREGGGEGDIVVGVAVPVTRSHEYTLGQVPRAAHFLSSAAPLRASSLPLSVRLGSFHPVKRLSCR